MPALTRWMFARLQTALTLMPCSVRSWCDIVGPIVVLYSSRIGKYYIRTLRLTDDTPKSWDEHLVNDNKFGKLLAGVAAVRVRRKGEVPVRPTFDVAVERRGEARIRSAACVLVRRERECQQVTRDFRRFAYKCKERGPPARAGSRGPRERRKSD